MKLFTFDRNNYGASYHVMSSSRESALEALKKYFLKELEDAIENPTYHTKDCFKDPEGNWRGWSFDKTHTFVLMEQEDYNEWKNATVDNLPEGYAIVTRGLNEVFLTECS